jgi:acyl-coenzyme A synthetase/AMP-(fatty) acid ligase
MATRLRARMGDIEVVLEPVSELPRTNSGKIQTVICNLSPAEQRAVLDRRRTSAGPSAVRTSPGGR